TRTRARARARGSRPRPKHPADEARRTLRQPGCGADSKREGRGGVEGGRDLGRATERDHEMPPLAARAARMGGALRDVEEDAHGRAPGLVAEVAPAGPASAARGDLGDELPGDDVGIETDGFEGRVAH